MSIEPTTAHRSSGPVRVFTNPKRIGIAAAVSLSFAAIFFLGALLTFLLLLITPPNDKTSMMPGMLGGMMVVPIFLLVYGIVMLKSPLRASIDDEGLTAEWLIARKRLSWSQIAGLRRDKLGLFTGDSVWKPAYKRSNQDVLILLDDRARELARLTSALADFPALVAEIEARSSAARGTPTYDRAAQVSSRRARARRNSRLLAVLGVFMAAIAVAVAVMSITEHRANIRLDHEGVPVEARIVRHYIYRVTPRLEYSFKDAAGVEHTRDAMLTREAWDRLTGSPTVEVQYVPARPGLNRLLRGEVPGQELPVPLAIAAVVVMGGMALLMLAAPLLGIADLKIKNGKLLLVRFDQIGDDLEEGPAPGTPAAVVAAPAILPGPATVPAVAAAAGARAGRAVGGGITAMGVLNLAFGLWCAGLNAVRLLVMGWMASQGGVVQTPAGPVEAHALPFALATQSAGLLLGLLLLTSGIGLLVRRRWGRTLALVAAAGQCLLGIVLLAGLFIDPPPVSWDENDPNRIQLPLEQIGAVIGVLIGMIYPVVVLAVLGRRSVRDRLAT